MAGVALEWKAELQAEEGMAQEDFMRMTRIDELDDSKRIKAGHILWIRILEDQKEPIQLRVGVTGQINFPHIGLQQAAGLSFRQLAFEVKKRLEESYYEVATPLVAYSGFLPDGTRMP